MRLPATTFTCEPDPENPGWLTWDVADTARFNAATMGKMLVRKEGENTCRLRMFPGVQHANLPGSVHGGVTAEPSMLTTIPNSSARLLAFESSRESIEALSSL